MKIDASVHRTYRAFILRSEIQERARVARTDRGRGTRVTHAQGRHFDLDSMFDRLNLVATAPVEEIIGTVLTESGYQEFLQHSEDEEDAEK